MTKLCMIFAALLALVLPVQAQAQAQDRASQPASEPGAVGGPLFLIYVVSGVRDNGGAINTGTATSFHCTNASTVSENVRHIVRNFDGTITSNNTFVVLSARTHTASTHGTVAYNEDAFLSTGTLIEQGNAFIFATSRFVFCTAVSIDAAAASPAGVALHMVRFNPQDGTQE